MKMTSASPANRRTRSSSPAVTGTRNYNLGGFPERASRRSAKRRMVYPTEESPPAKRRFAPSWSLSSSSQSENDSPVKVTAKSFYGAGKGRYLNPLERKELGEMRQNKISSDSKGNEPKEAGVVNIPVSVTSKAQETPAPSLSRGIVKRSSKSGLASRKLSKQKAEKPPLQEIVPGSPKSPVKNRVGGKEETRVYSPSRSGRKFFKSRRITDNSNQPAAVVQKNALHVKYQPQGVSTKSKEGNEKKSFTKLLPSGSPAARTPFPTRRTITPRSSPLTISASPVLSSEASPATGPAANTRSSPRKAHTAQKKSQVKQRITSSSKKPHSQDLFSVSDWDFDDEVDMGAVNALSCSMDVNVSDSDTWACLSSVSEALDTTGPNSSTADDSVSILSEVSVKSSPSNDQVSPAENSISDPKEKKLFSIFRTRNDRRNAGNSNRKSPVGSSRTRMKNLGKVGQPSKLRSLIDKRGREQLTLDFGQKLIGAVQCPTCSMTYNQGEPSDEATHKKFHDHLLMTLKFPGWKREHTLQEFADGGRIIVVMSDEKQAMKKVAAVKKVVDEDLGFVVDSASILSNSKTFMYISSDKKIVGFCIAESISTAYRVLSEEELSKFNSVNGTKTRGSRRATAPTATNPQSDMVEDQSPAAKPWCCSTDPERARCGINRIWVLHSERRKGTASKLLDCVRDNFLLGFPLRKSDIAFTDPTPDGRSFAREFHDDVISSNSRIP